MKLEQGQIWKQGEDYFRIVTWARESIIYKTLADPLAKTGTVRTVTKKEFCRLVKGAVLLPGKSRGVERAAPDADVMDENP